MTHISVIRKEQKSAPSKNFEGHFYGLDEQCFKKRGDKGRKKGGLKMLKNCQ